MSLNYASPDSDLLRAFLAIAETGSITGAADRLARTQSAISLRLQRLEDSVGAPLFDRGKRGVRLTRHGERMMPRARQVVALLDGMASDLRADGPRGELRVGIPDDYGAKSLPRALASFARAYPGVDLTMRCGDSEHFPNLLDRGYLDIAVFMPDRVEADHTILAQERVSWAEASRGGPLDISPLPVALFDRDCWWRERSLTALERAKRPFRTVFTSESVAGVRAAVAAGIAIGVLPERVIRGDVREIPASAGLASLGETDVVLKIAKNAPRDAAEAMRDAIVSAFR